MTITVVTMGKFVCTFSYGKVKDIFQIRIKFHLEKAKGRSKREYGEKPKMRCILAKFPLFSKIKLYLTNC